MTIPTVTDDLIAEIESAAKHATPGQWAWDDDVPTDWGSADWSEIAPWLVGQELGPILSGQIVSENPANADYIAIANPANVLALTARLRELEKDAARYRWLRDRAANVEYSAPMVIMVDEECEPVSGRNWSSVQHSQRLDESIDAAMQGDL